MLWKATAKTSLGPCCSSAATGRERWGVGGLVGHSRTRCQGRLRELPATTTGSTWTRGEGHRTSFTYTATMLRKQFIKDIRQVNWKTPFSYYILNYILQSAIFLSLPDFSYTDHATEVAPLLDTRLFYFGWSGSISCLELHCSVTCSLTSLCHPTDGK